MTPIRYLLLERLREATSFGLTPERLAHLLRMPPSTLAHHLEALENADLIERRPLGLYDRRRVSVRPTREGRYAARRLAGVLHRSIRL